MMSNSNNNNGGHQKKNGNFDTVPADDSFRNYMARKIELQRKQFGLVVPPPPPSPPPSKQIPPKILKKAKLAKSNADCVSSTGKNDTQPTSQFTSTNSSNDDNTTISIAQPKKSVRFHQNLEVEGVSQLLDSLKRKHTTSSGGRRKVSRLSSAHKRRRRKSRGVSSLNNANGEYNETTTANSLLGGDDTTESNNSNAYKSVLGVLDNLQKKHGTTSNKKRRSSSPSNSFSGEHSHDDYQSDGCQTTMSVLESLDSVDDSGSSPIGILKNGNPANEDSTSLNEDSTTPSKKKRESPRCMGESVLEGLEPGLQDSIRQQKDGPRQSNCFDREYTKQPEATKMPSEEASTHSSKKLYHRPDLFFMGVVVLVNGHTSPDATTLMRLLHKHGGDLEKYETERVTHIIAEQLSAAKANVYKRQKKATPVCRPDWITDSVDQGKLLPFGDYLLKDVMDMDAIGTKSVKSFFNTKPLASTNQSEHSPKRTTNKKDGEMPSNDYSTNEPVSSDRWQDTHPSKSNYTLNDQVRTVGNDPNFLDSYFSNSRLSYIGSFKQRIKPKKSTGCHSPSKVGARKFVLLVDMDCFFAAVILRKYPQYRDKPVAVGHSNVERCNMNETSGKTSQKNSSSELSTCNYIARKHGIRKGMFLGDAIIKCPELVVLPYDFEGYEEVSGIVVEQLRCYAEQYNGCVEVVSCDESYVEINIIPDDCAGSDVYEFLNTLANHIRSDILKKTECTASIGIGPNKVGTSLFSCIVVFGYAFLFVNFYDPHSFPQLLAKLAADKIKPNACCVVKDPREFLEELNLRDLPGIGRKFQKKLQAHNLITVNDVWDLADDAENVLTEIIGKGTAHKIVQFCKGEDDRQVTPATRKSIGAECNYGVRFNGPYGVDYMIQGLAKEVNKRMSAVGVRGSKLVLKIMISKDPTKVPGKFLGHGLCDSLSRSIDIQLTRNEDVISSATIKLYKKLNVDDSSIRGMGIVINSLKFDDELNSLDSSPSKLSAWLQQDMTAASTATTTRKKMKELPDNSQNVAFAIEEESKVISTETDSSIMPTFSQLDQDVLNSLPEDILLEVKSTYRKSSSQQCPTGVSPKSTKTKRLGKDKAISIAGQTSVRRMLKLACVKSGDEQIGGNNDLSLSQLDSLPLELQLQIANEDNIEITKRPKHRAKRAVNSHFNTANQNDYTNIDVLSVSSLEIEEQGRCSSTDSDQPTNFHHENIAPLRDFISSNPNPDREAVDAVQDFLSVCISERRIEDTVIFLRTIKNMDNGWDKAIYEQLRDLAVNEVMKKTGILDVRWLGL